MDQQRFSKIDEVSLPYVSVVMPVRNESDFIERSLSAVLAQSYPSDRMEIIIADGMSSDDTREKISAIADRTDVAITLIDNPAGTAPVALNRAIAKAKGDIVVRVDGHCEIDPEYVANCVELLMRGVADGVGGPIETIAESPQAEAIAIAMSSKFGVGGSAFRTVRDQELEVDTVAFPGYKRDLFDRLGGFDEELVRNQDDEFNYRLRKNGGKLLLSPSLKSRYYSRSSFRSLWRQYFQYGYWKVRVMQLHPAQMSIRQFIPFLFVTSVMSLALLSVVSSIALWLLGIVVGMYLLANLLASVMSMRNGSLGSIPRISLSFAILHVAYGTGFLFGLVAFRRRWAGEAAS